MNQSTSLDGGLEYFKLFFVILNAIYLYTDT